MDIIERVLHPAFAAEPYGLNAPPRLPVTIYTSLTRFPAVLQVDRFMRTESTAVYLSLARSKIVDLEIANKNLYDEYEDLRKDLEGNNTFMATTAGVSTRSCKPWVAMLFATTRL
jgi:hypothetical protein